MLLLFGKIFLSGILFLMGAILINSIAKYLNFPSWYDFLNHTKITLVSSVWLFIIYPLLLGVLGFYISKLFLNK